MLVIFSSSTLPLTSCFVHVTDTVTSLMFLLNAHRWLLNSIFVVCLAISSMNVIYLPEQGDVYPFCLHLYLFFCIVLKATTA